jgi:hypothetical protein
VDQLSKLLNLLKKAVLVIDNVPAHPDDVLSSGDVRVIILPCSITSLCQLMDQGVLEVLKKKRYCKLTVLFDAADNEDFMLDNAKESGPKGYQHH